MIFGNVRFTPRVLFTLGLLVHVFFLLGVMDTYFTSPLDSGLPSHRSGGTAISKRVVLIVSDGLRAEGMFRYEHSTPFLTDMRKRGGSWGVGHTQVPTESRPGHVAILAGIYEDPSAIYKGWQANAVKFDSVIKQCKNAYSWGSPDIVNIFSKGEHHVYIHAYDIEMEDFSGKRLSKEQDIWVFDKVTKFFDEANKLQDCGRICQDGNIFFLHLLGMDTAGHVNKPDSRAYVDNLLTVDRGIKDITATINNFFRDNRTTFIMTSDHGMTDWGSHGSGSLYETEVPVIAWGAGIARTRHRQDVNQADLAPLIAGLLGIHIPINSIGKLPIDYLSATPAQIASAAFTNAKQLSEQFLRKDLDSSRNLVYFPFKKLMRSDVGMRFIRMEMDYDSEQYESVISSSIEMIDLCVEGVRYYQYYYQIPTLICLTICFFGWFIFMLAYINTTAKPSYLATQNKYRLFAPILYLITILMIVFLAAYSASSKYYLYLIFFFMVYYCLSKQMSQSVNNMQFQISSQQVVIFFCYMETLVLSFFNRQFLALSLLILAIWSFVTYRNFSKKLMLRWIFSLSTTCIFLFLPMQNKFNYFTYIGTIFLWFAVSICTLHIRFMTTGLYLYLTACVNAVIIAVFFDLGYGVPTSFHVMSYAIVFFALCTIRLSSGKIVPRLTTIVCCLMAVYMHVTLYTEGLFYCAYVTTMFTWLELEHRHNARSLQDSWNKLQNARFAHVTQPRPTVCLDDYRRVAFFITFVIVSFFGTGNMASISSFDPMAARAFSSTFRPFLIFAVLIFKIMIPLFICSCTFVAISTFGRAHPVKVFAIIMLFCDMLVFNFLFLIKNEGSWLEIGTSLSHFIIAEAMAVVLIVFYYVSIHVMRYGANTIKSNL